MELLFIILFAATLGFIAQYTIPGQETRGTLVVAAAASIAAAVVWVALLWLGFTFDGGWIWLISLVVSGVAAVVVAIVLPRSRRTSDKALLTKLSGGKA